MKKFNAPTLYSLDAQGRIRQWDISVKRHDVDGTATITRIHGLMDGKKQTNHKAVEKGKNIGRSNETTPFEQAVSEAKSMWLKAKDKGFQEEMPDPKNPPILWLPMKAKGWHQQKHKINYPAYIQPKFNGVRCMVELKFRNVIYHSARNKVYTVVNHLDDALRAHFPNGIVPDGELYHHGWPLNKIVSMVKKRHKGTVKIQLWIFDLVQRDLTFEERWEYIENAVPDNHPLLIKAPTYRVKNEAEVDRFYNRFLRKGFEGAMIRNVNGAYRLNYRSYDVLKRPEYIREEFPIIGGKEGTGLDAGCVVFLCKAKNGKPFEVRPQGSVELRQRYFRELKKLKGKKLTVKFKEYTEYGVPHCPTGEAIRDYE